MSIILKGIDLPTKYDSSYFLKVSPDGVFQGEDFAYTKLFSGEAIQIPKGHGDIVDKDELIIRRDIESDRGIIGYYEAINNDANVLLKSEEE